MMMGQAPSGETAAVKSAASRLRAALAAVLVQADAPELALVHRWFDNWHGVGLLAVELHRIGYDLLDYGRWKRSTARSRARRSEDVGPSARSSL